jgi:two-component system chemotaxis response regulator CheB
MGGFYAETSGWNYCCDAMYDFYVIGIGSSAGGITPLAEIISGLPVGINAAIIVIQHIPADAQSSLDAILSKTTRLKVVTIETIDYVEPGHIYVMAAGKSLRLKDRLVWMEDRPEGERMNRTIDTFFTTLANEVNSKAIGVILSGAGYDGLAGAIAIENENGLMIVQDPETAQFPLMPQTLIANDHPDYILTPAEITTKIIEYTGSQNA